MQRRAAAVSVAFLLVLSAGAYVTLTAADAPSIQVENPERTLSANETFSPGDVTYTVTELSDGSAKLAWTNETYRYIQSFSEGDTIQYRDGTYAILIPNNTTPTHFTLRENQTVDEPTVTQNGTTYVIVEDGENKTLVPVDEYLPEPRTETFELGDDLVYQNNTWTVGDITNTTVSVYRIAPRTNTITLSEGGVETFAGTEYVAHFDDGRLLLSTDVEAYNAQVENQRYFTERINGLWGVTVISGVTAALLAMFAFLPSRY